MRNTCYGKRLKYAYAVRSGPINAFFGFDSLLFS